MLVILEATAGPVTGTKIEALEGSTVRVGRTAKSDYALREDSYLSSQHFAIECYGKQCRIRDLGSSNGTFVNGDRITDRIVHEGDSVGAGGSTFIVHIDSSRTGRESSHRVIPAPTLKYPGPGGLENSGPSPQRDDSPTWAGFSRTQSLVLSALYRGSETV